MILQTTTVNKTECAEYNFPLVLCTTKAAGSGDSGAGYIQQINSHATVVAVHSQTHIYQDSGTRLVAHTIVSGDICIPMQWIRDHIWPTDMNCYPNISV